MKQVIKIVDQAKEDRKAKLDDIKQKVKDKKVTNQDLAELLILVLEKLA